MSTIWFCILVGVVSFAAGAVLRPVLAKVLPGMRS